MGGHGGGSCDAKMIDVCVNYFGGIYTPCQLIWWD